MEKSQLLLGGSQKSVQPESRFHLKIHLHPINEILRPSDAAKASSGLLRMTHA
jgi:hypothetical protein